MDPTSGMDAKVVEGLWRSETEFMTQDFQQTMREIEEAHNQDRRIEDASHAALFRLLKRDPEFARQVEAWAEERTDAQPEPLNIKRPVRDLRIPEPGQRTLDYTEGSLVGITPPYLHKFAATGGFAGWVNSTADENTGKLKLSCIAGRNLHAAYAAAGVGIIFARLKPGGKAFEGPVGWASFRPHCGTWCRWTNNPAFGTTSLTGGSGVRIRSFDEQGNFPEEVLDHRTVDFSNNGWIFGTQHNYWPNGDAWPSFQGGNTPVGFVIKPHRVYIAWVWFYLYAEARNMTSFGYVKAALEADIYGASLSQL